MDCAACARKVETAVRQLAGVNQVQVLFATESWWSMPRMTFVHKFESALQKAGYSLRDEQAAEEPQASPLKEESAADYANRDDGNQLGSGAVQSSVRSTGRIATTLVGLYPIARQALTVDQIGSYFAIETLMSVAAIGALFHGATAEAAMVLLLFLIGRTTGRLGRQPRASGR